MSLSNTSYGGTQTSLLVFSCIVLAIKFLDITKFGILELGPNSDKNLAVGAISLVVIAFFVASFALVFHEAVERYIDDGRIGSPNIPDFSMGESPMHPIVIPIKFFIGYTLFFIFKLLPLIFGLMTLFLIRSDIVYFSRKIWGLLFPGASS